MKKLNIDPSASTPPKIPLLSPGIDGSYTMSRSTTSVTTDKMNPNKKALPEIRKAPKIDFDGTYYDHRESDSHCKESDLEYEG